MTSQEFKQKCIELRNKNYTISEIMTVLKRPKTSIYTHIRNIPKSKALIDKIRKNNLPHLDKLHLFLKGRSWTGRHCRGFQSEFLKAFFDDEGCVTFKGRKRIVRGYQYNNEILFLVQKLLKNFDIESKVDARFHEIVISRRENLKKFAKEINFLPGLKINSNRSNSIWKQDLEKREILRRALSSYLI